MCFSYCRIGCCLQLELSGKRQETLDSRAMELRVQLLSKFRRLFGKSISQRFVAVSAKCNRTSLSEEPLHLCQGPDSSSVFFRFAFEQSRYCSQTNTTISINSVYCT